MAQSRHSRSMWLTQPDFVVLLNYKLCNVYSDMTCLDTIKLDLGNARIPVRMLRRKLMYIKARWVSLVD